MCMKSSSALIRLIHMDGMFQSTLSLRSLVLMTMQKWLSTCGIYQGLGVRQPGPTVIYQDNAATISLAKNQKHHDSSRLHHVNIRIYRMREFVHAQEILPIICSTNTQQRVHQSISTTLLCHTERREFFHLCSRDLLVSPYDSLSLERRHPAIICFKLGPTRKGVNAS